MGWPTTGPVGQSQLPLLTEDLAGLLHRLSLAAVAETRQGLLQRDPAHLIHLKVVLARISPGVLEKIEVDPLVDAMPCLAVHKPVFDLPDLPHTPRGEPRLFPHFTKSCLLGMLAPLPHPLGQGPHPAALQAG